MRTALRAVWAVTVAARADPADAGVGYRATALAFERAIGSQLGDGDGQFNVPFGVAALPGGRLAVADTGNHRVVVLDAATGAFEHAIGSEGGGDGQFNHPVGVAALPGGRLAVADWSNSRVVLLAPTA